MIDQSPVRIRRRDEVALAAIRGREGIAGTDLAAHLIEERGVIGARELTALTGAGPGEIAIAVERVGKRITPDHLVSSDLLRKLEPAAMAALEAFHTEHPLAPGMAVDDLSALLGIDRTIFNALASSWPIVREGNTVRSAGHGPGLTTEQRTVADLALGTLRDAGASPPTLRDAGLPPDVARAMERTGELVFLTQDIAYPADVWGDIQRRVVELIASTGPVTVSQVREAIGTSRKYAVPLLERFDAAGITRRNGDVRDLGPRGRELIASN